MKRSNNAMTNGVIILRSIATDNKGRKQLCLIFTQEGQGHKWASGHFTFAHGERQGNGQNTAANRALTAVNETCEELLAHFFTPDHYNKYPTLFKNIKKQLTNTLPKLARRNGPKRLEYWVLDLRRFLETNFKWSIDHKTNPIWHWGPNKKNLFGNPSGTRWVENMQGNKAIKQLDASCFECTNMALIPIKNIVDVVAKNPSPSNASVSYRVKDVYGRTIVLNSLSAAIAEHAYSKKLL
jgi:hypothetical protein